MLIKKPRRGYFIAPKRIELNLNDFSAIKKEIEAVGRKNKAILLNCEKISMGKRLSEMTRLPEGTLCYQLLRLRYENDRQMSLERSYLIAEHVPELTLEDLENRPFFASILKQDYGITLVSAEQRITQVYADDMESELLKVSREEPIIKYEGLVYDRKGRLIEFFDNAIVPDSIELHIRDFA